MKLIAIGDNVVDVYVDRNEMFPGGNALNVAVLAKHSGALETAFIGIIGNDVEGDHILASLKQCQVDTSLVRRAYGESGKAYVDLDETGDRIFVKSNKGGIQSKLRLKLSPDDFAYIEKFDVLHTSIYSSLEDQLPYLAELLPVSYDFSNHYSVELLQQVCPYLTFAFVSGSDLSDQEITDLVLHMHQYGAKYVIVTRGGQGVILSTGEQISTQGIAEANVIDTLGAGDSFIAGFLTSYMNQASIPDALQFAAFRAARTCETNGAFGLGKQLQEEDDATTNGGGARHL